MPVFPDDGQRIGADRHHIGDARGFIVGHCFGKYFGIWLRFHILMPAPAGGAWTCRTQQPKGINACMSAIPGEGKLTLAFVCCNSSWFFGHFSFFLPSLFERGGVCFLRFRHKGQKICRCPASTKFVIRSNEIPPGVSICFLRTILYKKYFGIFAAKDSFCIQPRRRADVRAA